MRRGVVVLLVSIAAGPWVSTTASAAGEELLTTGGCISCHRVDQKLLGPAFKEVAARYRGNTEAAARLFTKVREGGEGEWGDLPMQPNGVEKISDADLRAVLDWILQL